MKTPTMVSRSTETEPRRVRDSILLVILGLCIVFAAALPSAEAQEARLLLRLDPELSDGIVGSNTKGGYERSDGIKGSNTKGGRELEKILQQGLVVDTGGASARLPVMFVSVIIRDRRAEDVFVSEPFEARPGLLIESAGGAYPPQVPEDLFAAGELESVSATEFPARRLEDYAVRVAMEAAQRARSPDGMFMVVVPAEPGARREISSSGLMIPMSERRH